jgi:7-keto-8-aminopelargonate synthetase-like enzyme
MTGKFTQHVHNLGYYLGHSLHSTIRRAYHDGSASEPVANATKFAWISKHFGPKEAECAAHTATSSSTLQSLITTAASLPQLYKTWWLNLLQTDPLHVLIETLLIVFCIILVILQRRADWRMDNERKRSKLNEGEVEELLAEWKNNRGKLGARKDHAEEVGNGLIVDGVEGSRLLLSPDSKLLFSEEDGGNKPVPRSVVNFATHDYLSASSSPTLKSVALTSLEKYGCGSCGPRGFYGTIDAHLEIESCISSFLGTDGAILYSDGASASTSTVAAFAKRGDLLVVDEGVNEALLVGVSLSRANVRYFRHNDVNDLRRVLEKVRHQDIALKRKPTDQRRFLVVEGLYKNWGTMCPLNEIVKLKEEFCFRLILDDSHAIGAMGEMGRGSLERCGLKPMQHCEILTFSIENALGSVGGITVGSEGKLLRVDCFKCFQLIEFLLLLLLFVQHRSCRSSKTQWCRILLQRQCSAISEQSMCSFSEETGRRFRRNSQ